MTPDPSRLTLAGLHNPVRGLICSAAVGLSLAGGILLLTRSSGDLARQCALLAFALSLVALYATSVLYHTVPWRPDWKRRMQRLDHSMIYVLVAGTFTPLAVVVLPIGLAWATLGAVWGIAALGIAQKLWLPHFSNGLSITLQTVQGWLGLAILWPLAERLPATAVALAVVGGLLYTTDLVLFVTGLPLIWSRVFSSHEVFHLFVVSGSSAHYALMLWFVAPYVAP